MFWRNWARPYPDCMIVKGCFLKGAPSDRAAQWKELGVFIKGYSCSPRHPDTTMNWVHFCWKWKTRRCTRYLQRAVDIDPCCIGARSLANRTFVIMTYDEQRDFCKSFRCWSRWCPLDRRLRTIFRKYTHTVLYRWRESIMGRRSRVQRFLCCTSNWGGILRWKHLMQVYRRVGDSTWLRQNPRRYLDSSLRAKRRSRNE